MAKKIKTTTPDLIRSLGLGRIISQGSGFIRADGHGFEVTMRQKSVEITRDIVVTMEQILKTNGNKAGAFIMQKAKRLIRRVDPKTILTMGRSKPGQPPKTRTGRLKGSIRFAWDDSAGTIVVGPIFEGSLTTHILEFGGTTKYSTNFRGDNIREGTYGYIDVFDKQERYLDIWISRWRTPAMHTAEFDKSHPRTAPETDNRFSRRILGRTEKGRYKQLWAVRRLLSSASMVARAKRIWREKIIKIPFKSDYYTMSPRPYMQPALLQSLPEIIAEFAKGMK